MKVIVTLVSVAVLAMALVVTGGRSAFAAPSSDLTQTISAGVLSTDILDGTRTPVASPSVGLGSANFSFNCQTSTGTLGTASQRLYVMNPGTALNTWTLTMAATGGATTKWSNTGATNNFAFNNAAGSGCTGGQLTVNPTVAAITTDCGSCNATNVSKGASTAFVSGTVDSVTLMKASASASNPWRGYMTGIGLSQAIPAEQAADSYKINMTLTITAA